MSSRRYILVYKPYGVLSQFTDRLGKVTLRALGPFPPGVYAAGRLDEDSEGLLLLTDDGPLKHRLTDPRFHHPRTYLVQIDGIPDDQALQHLRKGVLLQGGRTRPATVRLLPSEPDLPPRSVPIRFRKNIPTSWLEITLTEGRNRQVRRMTAAAGHPTLRIIRIRIGSLTLGTLQPGEHRDLSETEIRDLRTSVGFRGPKGKKDPRHT